jgi:hypothetical protein
MGNNIKLTLDSMLSRVFEIQVNQNGRLKVSTSLFHQIQRPSVFNKEIIIKSNQEVGVFIGFHREIALNARHTCKGTFLTFIALTM